MLFSDYRRALAALQPVLAGTTIELDRLPPAYEVWFANAAARRAKRAAVAFDPTRLAPKIAAALFPYQREGVERAVRSDGRLFLCDEMGLGKSLQSIAVADYYATKDTKQLVVCPSYLRHNWQREFAAWTDVEPAKIQLVMKTKHPLDPEATHVVISYDLAVRKIAELAAVPWTTIIVDECHYVKSRKAKRTKALTPLLQRAPHLLMLSGTPALSRPEELFAQLHALFPRTFKTFSTFAFRYCDFKQTYFGWDSSGASNSAELHVVMKELMVRRLKCNVLKDLPTKMREELHIPLRPKELKEMQPIFRELDKLSNELSQVREASEDSRRKAFERQALVSQLFRLTAAAKLPALVEYVQNLIDSKAPKTVLFGHHMLTLDAIEEVCRKKNTPYIRVDGRTPQHKRLDLIDTFRFDPTINLALLGLQACCTGINITPVNHMTFCELNWTPSVLLQAEDRLHRIGATGTSCHYTYLIGDGSLDEKVFAKLGRKYLLMDAILDGGANRGGFDTSGASVMEREAEDLDLERLGLGTYTKLRLEGDDRTETIELSTLVETYGLPLSASTLEQTGVRPPRVDGPWPGDDCVNLSQCSAPVPPGHSFYLLLDLGAEDRAKMRSMEAIDVFDSLLGIGVEVDASACSATAFAVRESTPKRRRVA